MYLEGAGMYKDEENDGRYPDKSPIEVRYPRSKQEERGDRSRWPPAVPAQAGIATCRV
jgi:hypothetical protein